MMVGSASSPKAIEKTTTGTLPLDDLRQAVQVGFDAGIFLAVGHHHDGVDRLAVAQVLQLIIGIQHAVQNGGVAVGRHGLATRSVSWRTYRWRLPAANRSCT